MNRLEIKDKVHCTGCGACQNICPIDAISMQWDEEGFPYPHISNDCIDCGKCNQVCPMINPIETYGDSLEMTTVYAAWSKKESRRIQSTSGGVFSELALSVYDQGGVVVGAVYDEVFMIHHECSEKVEDLERLRQSKYAQSDIRLVFREIKKFLSRERLVLFCGTPCQAAGLRAYLGGVPQKLILCDFICRGTNSPKAYASYLEMLEKHHGAKITKVQFKNKDEGWNRFHTKISFEDGTAHFQDRYTDPYMQAYLKYNLIIRPCCHSCQFKGNFRNVDLSLGDFWGVGKYAPELDENKGTSVVIASTEKGRLMVGSLDDQIVCHVMDINQIDAGNPCLRQSAQPGTGRNCFLRNLDHMSFDNAMGKYGKDTMRMKLRRLSGRGRAKFRNIFLGG